MAIPKKIHNVPRPANTSVHRTSNGDYGVYASLPCSTEQQGQRGPLVGHIVNLQYVPIPEYCLVHDADTPFMVSFGAVALILSVGLELLLLLIKAFSLKMGRQIFVVACLKILFPHITEANMKGHYTNSYLSVTFPNLALSKNTVANLFRDIGLNEQARNAFIQMQLSALSQSHVIYLDGSLRQFNSSANILSKTPYKKKYGGFDVINVMYAYVEGEHFLFSSVYPGSFSDTSIYRKFLLDNQIFKGILVGDAAFVPSVVEKLIEENAQFADLKFIGYLKSNDKTIAKLNLLDFDDVFDSAKGKVLCKKVKDESTNIIYYSFKNLSISHQQEEMLIDKVYKNETNLKEEYTKNKALFGVRVVKANVDLKPEDVYEILLERWSIETLFQKQKSHLKLNTTNVHSEFSVIGQEFINAVATTLYQRVCEKIKNAQLIKNTTYKSILDQLNSSWRRVSNDERLHVQENTSWIFNEGKPTTNDSSWVYTTKKTFAILEALGLSKPSACDEQHKNNTKSIAISKKKSDTDKQNGKSSIVKIFLENIEKIFQCVHNIMNALEKNYSKVITSSDESVNYNSNNSNISNNKHIGRPQGSLNTKTLLKNNVIKLVYVSLKNVLSPLQYIYDLIHKFNDLSS